jgi:hypothetical protein
MNEISELKKVDILEVRKVGRRTFELVTKSDEILEVGNILQQAGCLCFITKSDKKGNITVHAPIRVGKAILWTSAH